MKKSLIPVLLVVILSGFIWSSDRFFVNLNARCILPFDSGYTDLYGKTQFSPGAKFGCEIFGGIFIWGGYGFSDGKGTIPLLTDSTRSIQHFLSAGIGFRVPLSERTQWIVYAGGCDALYREEAMGLVVNDSAWGFDAGTDFRFFLKKKWFISLTASCTYVRTVARPPQGGTAEIELGGACLGGGIGFTF